MSIQEVHSQLPISHEVALLGHQKAIQALALDSSGTRLISGGLDFLLKMWDLSTMNKKLRSFKEFKPFDGHPVTALDFSNDDQNILICCANHSAKVLTRDGGKVQVTIRGDQYISDVAQTKGHVASITDGKFHPVEDKYFLTSSVDGSVRLWDLESKAVGVDQQLMQQVVLKPRNERGLKVAVISCSFSPYAQYIGGGCSDGSVQVWDARLKKFHRPVHLLDSAHERGTEVSCVQFFEDELRMVSRGLDDTMKLWDLRKAATPVHVWPDLTNLSSKTNICLSPNESLVLTGTSVRKGFGYGHIMAFDPVSGELSA
mmetsp:Transcript_26912/g.25975  ORF Transcript_26912/g.25975 Transcript_26912/m.25975 type:complete len:315 (-) Transcript_26912:621-1565(-)